MSKLVLANIVTWERTHLMFLVVIVKQGAPAHLWSSGWCQMIAVWCFHPAAKTMLIFKLFPTMTPPWSLTHILALFIFLTFSLSLSKHETHLLLFLCLFGVFFFWTSFISSLNYLPSDIVCLLSLAPVHSALRGTQASGPAQAEGHAYRGDGRHAASPPLHRRGPAPSTWCVCLLEKVDVLKPLP